MVSSKRCVFVSLGATLVNSNGATVKRSCSHYVPLIIARRKSDSPGMVITKSRVGFLMARMQSNRGFHLLCIGGGVGAFTLEEESERDSLMRRVNAHFFVSAERFRPRRYRSDRRVLK